MNYIQNKKIYLPKNPIKKKLRQSKLDNFLNNTNKNCTKKPNRSAMLENFFMGTVPPNTKTGKSNGKNQGHSNENSMDNSGYSNNTLESHVCIAITEGRSYARGEVGIASIDVNAPELILCQLSDDMWYSGTIIKIQMLNPTEILLPNTFFHAKLSDSKLLTILKSTFPTVDFKETPRKHFHDFEAMDKIEKISATKVEDIKIALENKYYALACCNALLSYVEIAYYLNFAPKSLKIVYESRYASLAIDMETSKRLELVSTLAATNEKKTCLFSFIDHCLTRIGKRSLRARILEPFADIQMINQCHEATKELMEKENYLFTLRMILKKFYQVDRLMKLSLITPLDDNVKAAETMIGQTLMLKSCLQAIPAIYDILTSMESSVFVSIRSGLDDPRYKVILDHIDRILFTDQTPQTGQNRNQLMYKINAVKPDVDQVLDVSRGFYSKILDEISDYVKDISTKYSLSFQLVHNSSKGYQLLYFVNRTMPNLNDELIVLTKRGNKVWLTSEKLNELNSRLKIVIDDILVMSNTIISEMLLSIRKEIDVVYLLTGIITELDLTQCFASLTKSCDLNCPTFGQDIKIVDAIHPFLEYGRLKTLPIPNNIIATPDHNFFIITGPNMGGKTVYIKMIAVLQVMAQIGCFVPASSAQFRICDKLFSRIGFEDSVDKGISSFGMEVEQISFILNNITANSLVIIDELGRGTNPEDGLMWARKMSEQLINLRGYVYNGKFYTEDSNQQDLSKSSTSNGLCVRRLRDITSPFIFMTTHFSELTKLSEEYFNSVNLFMVSQEEIINGVRQLNYTHKIQVGVNPIREYGLALAKTVKFPMRVVPRAEILMQKIFESRPNSSNSGVLSNNTSSSKFSSNSTADNSNNERKFYELYANLVTLIRRRDVDQIQIISQEISKVLKNFTSKCCPTTLDAFKNQQIGSIFNNSAIFAESISAIDDSIASIQQMPAIISQSTVPETQDSIFSVETNKTAVTDTSWLSRPAKEVTIISKLSYHSLLRRIAERNDKDISEETCSRFSSFNEEKGFKSLPFIKPISEKSNNSMLKMETSSLNHSLNNNILLYSSFKTPETYVKGYVNNGYERSPEMFNDIEEEESSHKEMDKILGSGDFHFSPSQRPINSTQVPETSFFNFTQIDDTLDWDDEISQNGDFKFESPKFKEISNLFGESPDKKKFKRESVSKLDFFDTTKDEATDLMELFNTQPKPSSIIDLTSTSSKSSFQKLNKQMSPLNQSISSGNSQYQFRLKLLDYNEDSFRTRRDYNDKFNNYEHNCQAMEGYDNIDEELEFKMRQSYQNQEHSRSQTFEEKYAHILKNNYSQQNNTRCTQKKPYDKNEFIGKYGQFLNKSVTDAFKPPWIKPNSTTVFSGERNPNRCDSISTISYNETKSVPDLDSSDWLAQYCQNRVKNLGIPKRTKPYRKNKTKQDIDFINSKWKSFYEKYGDEVPGGSTSKMSRKSVSFSSSQSDEN